MNAVSHDMEPGNYEEVRAVELGLSLPEEETAENSHLARFDGLRASEKIGKISSWGLYALAAIGALEILAIAFPSFGPFVALVTLVIAIIGAAGLKYGLTRIKEGTIEPLERVTGEMDRLANGHRDIRIEGLHREDEIGDLSRALEVFVKSGHKLDELFADRNKSQEELERQHRSADEQRRAELGRLAQHFDQSIGSIVSGVAAASSQLQETATSMASSAEQAASQTKTVSASMEQARSGVTSAATATDEFAMSIGEISRQATQSAELARKASETADSADETIGELDRSTAEVGQIVELIQSIAQKTNLLALNASIEAARGGEAGRGFAVVASEVKELANQTSRATEEIADQIRGMQNSAGASVNALRSIIGQIEQLESTAVSIASAVDQQSVAGRDLAKNIDMAARATDEVSGNIEQVREASLANGSAASQVLSSATALEGQASTLRDQVDQFLRQVRAG